MRRWPLSLRIGASVLLALVVLHSAGWWWLSGQVRSNFAAWVAGQQSLGRTVTAGDPVLTGWPLAAGIAVPGLSIGGPGWRWTADHVSLTLQPWAPSRLRVEPSGHQAFVAGAATVAMEARTTVLSLALPAGDDVTLHVTGAVFDTPFGRASADTVAAAAASGSGVEASLAVSNLSLPPGPPYLLGPNIAELDVDLATPGPVPQPDVAGLAAWRDAGGTIRLDSLHLHWGTLTLDAAGTAALDRTLQPVADVRVSMSGQDSAIDQAAARGLIQPRAAMGIRAVLGLLAGARGGAIPASLRDGVVAVAGFPVARVPPVPWP